MILRHRRLIDAAKLTLVYLVVSNQAVTSMHFYRFED